MDNTLSRQAQMVCVLRAAHRIAKAAHQHIPDAILEAEIRNRGEWDYNDGKTKPLECAIGMLDELAELYQEDRIDQIRLLRKHTSAAVSRLMQATREVTGKSSGEKTVDACVGALCVATQAMAPARLEGADVRIAASYISISIADAQKAGLDIAGAVSEVLNMSESAWPIFITLLADQHGMFQAAEEAEMLTHQ